MEELENYKIKYLVHKQILHDLEDALVGRVYKDVCQSLQHSCKCQWGIPEKTHESEIWRSIRHKQTRQGFAIMLHY